MRKSRLFLPLAAFGLLLSMGLAACGNAGGGAGGSSSQQAQPKINVTAANNKTTLVMEEVVQLSADQEGVTWTSGKPEIASVSEQGLVTALRPGSSTITAKKEGFKNGTITITVTRPEALAKLHFEDAQHDSADGWWGTAAEGATPVYARSDGNASDGTCIAHFDVGDKETLRFTSSAVINAELVIMMASSSAISNMGEVMSAKLNNTPINLANKSFTGGSTSTFEEFSLGELSLAANNTLELEFLGSSTPYLDDLAIYAKQQATIALVNAPAKETIVPALPADQSMAAFIDAETAPIALTNPTSLDGVSFASDKEDIATVSEAGRVTGHKLGTANITIKKQGWYSARIEVVVDKAGLDGEIRVQAEDIDPLPSGFHKYTDKTSGIQNGHYGSAYITGYDVTSETTLSYTFNNTGSEQTMRLIIAGAPHYNMKDGDIFSFKDDCTITLNGGNVTVADDAIITGTGAAMGAATVEVTIGNVTVRAGENTFVITFAEKAPALDAYRFIPLSSLA